ncbi:hypothetical protein B0A48_17300 [Cryoendolithus antarcticus]|uniref:Uncharacterized protein n=1 Tax=Cryoendolithus antarcticus TaxID=1507870 RepID=A0A1V8SCK3_9PEZI|nr:hypothetical protein B0A48_17300 [Cryoendolithus antarcticus]
MRNGRMNWTADCKRALVVCYLMQKGLTGDINNANYDGFVAPIMNGIVGEWLQNDGLEEMRSYQAKKQLGDWMLQRTDRPAGWNVVPPPNDLRNVAFATDMARVEGIVRATIIRLGLQVPTVNGAFSFLALASAPVAPTMAPQLIVVLPVAMAPAAASVLAPIALPEHDKNNASSMHAVELSDRILYDRFILTKRTYADYVIDILSKSLNGEAMVAFLGAIYPVHPVATIKSTVDQSWTPTGFDFITIARLLKARLAQVQVSAFGVCDTFDSPLSPLHSFAIVGKALGHPLQMFHDKDVTIIDGIPIVDVTSFTPISTDVDHSTVYEYGGKVHTVSLVDPESTLGSVPIKLDAMICAKQICQACNPTAISLDHSRASLHGLPYVRNRDLDRFLISKDGFEVPVFAPKSNEVMMGGGKLPKLAKQGIWFWDGTTDDMGFSLEERHAIRLARFEAPALQLQLDQMQDWGVYSQIHNRQFGTSWSVKELRNEGVNWDRDKQNKSLKFEVHLQYGNFTQDDIIKRHVLRGQLLATAGLLGIDIGTGAMSANDGSPRPAGAPLTQGALAAHIAAHQPGGATVPPISTITAPSRLVAPNAPPAMSKWGRQPVPIPDIYYPEDDVFALDLRSTMGTYSDDQRLVLLSAAFPTWDMENFRIALGDHYGDVAKAWQAVVRRRTTSKGKNLENSLNVTFWVKKEVDGVQNRTKEPVFPFFESLTHFRSPLSTRPFPSDDAETLRIVGEIDARAMGQMLKVRHKPSIDNKAACDAATARLEQMPVERRVEVLRQVFAEYDATHPGDIAVKLAARSGKTRLMWSHLECQRRIAGVEDAEVWRPMFKFSETFTAPLSVLYLREQCVIIMEEEQRRTRSGGSRAIAGNFTQEDIDIRARLRNDIRNSAVRLKTDLGSGALSGNDGPPKLDATQQRRRDLAKFAREGGYFESASDHRKTSRAESHTVVDLTGQNDEAVACVDAARRSNGKHAHKHAVEGPVSVQDYVEAAKRRRRKNASGAGRGKIMDGSSLDEEQKLLLPDAAFPSLDLDHIGRHLGNCYSDVTEAWQAINIDRFTVDHGSLPRNLAAIAEVDGDHEPAFPFFECFDSLLSPAGPHIMEYIKNAHNAALEKGRLLEMVDSGRDVIVTEAKPQDIEHGEIVALLRYAFPQYERQSEIAIANHVHRSPSELRGIWVGLERFGREHRLRRPPFRSSESFSRPDSPI